MRLNLTEGVKRRWEGLLPERRRIIKRGAEAAYVLQVVGGVGAMNFGTGRLQEIGGRIFLANLGAPVVIEGGKLVKRLVSR